MRFLVLLPILLAACSDSRDVMDELPNSSIAGASREEMTETRMESSISRPVQIGEDGPRLAACGAFGVVRGLGAGQVLDLRAAPFREAKATASLGNGARVFVCTRSLDQRWLGIVVAPLPAPPGEDAPGPSADAAAPLDCGVSAPVETKRPYAGPCASGWVSSAYIQLVGR